MSESGCVLQSMVNPWLVCKVLISQLLVTSNYQFHLLTCKHFFLLHRTALDQISAVNELNALPALGLRAPWDLKGCYCMRCWEEDNPTWRTKNIKQPKGHREQLKKRKRKWIEGQTEHLKTIFFFVFLVFFSIFKTTVLLSTIRCTWRG